MMTVPPQLTSSLPFFSYPASFRHPPPASSHTVLKSLPGSQDGTQHFITLNMDSGCHRTRRMPGTYGRACGCTYRAAYGRAYGCAYGPAYGPTYGATYGCAYGATYGRAHGSAYGCAYGPQWCSRGPVSTARLGWDRAALCERTPIRPGLSRSSCTVDPVDPVGCKEWAKPNFLAPSETPEECAAETKFLGWKV